MLHNAPTPLQPPGHEPRITPPSPSPCSSHPSYRFKLQQIRHGDSSGLVCRGSIQSSRVAHHSVCLVSAANRQGCTSTATPKPVFFPQVQLSILLRTAADVALAIFQANSEKHAGSINAILFCEFAISKAFCITTILHTIFTRYSHN